METKQNIFTRPVFIVLCAVVVTALWGSATPAIKVGYEMFHIEAGDIPTKMLFAGVRFTLAGIMVLLIGFLTRRPMIPKKEDWVPVTVLGGLQTTLSYIFFLHRADLHHRSERIPVLFGKCVYCGIDRAVDIQK